MVLKPGHEAAAKAIFDKWELDFAVIGRITDTGNLTLRWFGETASDIPVKPLVEASPLYERPWEPTPPPPPLGEIEPPMGAGDALCALIGSPDLCSRRWVWEQYDHLIGGETVKRPGAADAAIVRLPGQSKALAVTTDCTPRYCLADPIMGGAQAVAEAWRNITATGAKPLAITNNMNFGNPERPRIMGQFVGCIKGMAMAGTALDFPVVSGNVSLYNETNGEAILPTPVIGGVGLIDDASKAVGLGFPESGLILIQIGESKGHMGQSIYARDILNTNAGEAPSVDLKIERRNGDVVRDLIAKDLVKACHDISDGGLAIAVAEMALASGIGATLDAVPPGFTRVAWLFGEDQARYVVAVSEEKAVLSACEAAGVPARRVGMCSGKSLTLPGGDTISVKELSEIAETKLPSYMAGDTWGT